MKKYPLKVRYIAKSAIWGGKLLSESWGKQGSGENVAETWELSVRPKEMGTVENGEAAGMALLDYFRAVGGDAVSPTWSVEERFPLLVKFIDAGDRLSVQVHPDDAYASRVENDSGKTEMWVIVAAEPGSTIVYGLADGVSREEFARAALEKRLDDVMMTLPVQAGDCFFIPAGMVHAIGGGILIAEIQQNSDLTYRVYDYDRRGADGKLRELHTETAMEVVRPYTEAEVDAIRFARGCAEGDLLANSKYFKAYARDIVGEGILFASSDSFVSVLCVGGEGVVSFEGEEYPISRGDSYFLPAGMGECSLRGDLRLICSEL